MDLYIISCFLQTFSVCLSFIPKRIKLRSKYQGIRLMTHIFCQVRGKIRILFILFIFRIQFNIILHFSCCQKIICSIFLNGGKWRFFRIIIISGRIDQNLSFRHEFSPVSCHQRQCCAKISSCTVANQSNIFRFYI